MFVLNVIQQQHFITVNVYKTAHLDITMITVFVKPAVIRTALNAHKAILISVLYVNHQHIYLEIPVFKTAQQPITLIKIMFANLAQETVLVAQTVIPAMLVIPHLFSIKTKSVKTIVTQDMSLSVENAKNA
jgi:hypothetical protein